jgi:hypothetical protein
MRWAGHAARISERRNTKFWLENLKGRDHLEDLGVDKRIILKCILENRVRCCGLVSCGSE